MKYIKKFNEGFFDKIESAIKGKSEKGKIVSEILKKYNIPEKGYAYVLRYVSGSGNREFIGHPLGYLLSHEPNKGKLQLQNGKLVLNDKNLLNRKVINIIPLVDKEEKEGIWQSGRIWQSCVIKFNYSFDLTSDNPIFTTSNSLLFDIDKGTWINDDVADDMNDIRKLDGVIDDEFEKESQEYFGSTVFNQDLLITYKEFIDECNKRDDILKIMTKSYKFSHPKEAVQPKPDPQNQEQPKTTQPVTEKMKCLKKFNDNFISYKRRC